MNKQVSIVGLGHVGLPLAAKIASLNFMVLGVDSDSRVISEIRSGKAPFYERGLSDLLLSKVVKENLRFAESWGDVRSTDIILITVGTPVTSEGSPIYDALDNCTESMASVLRPGQLIIYRSTVPPGTLRKRIKPMLEKSSGFLAGKDFQLAFCPERLVEGAALDEIINIPHVIGGIDEESTKSAAAFFESLGSKCLLVSKPEIAEMAKIMDNVYRDTNIALANEFSLVCDELGIDVIESIRAANTSPRTKVLIPGCGVGGSCLNKDPYVLLSLVKDSGTLPVVKASRQLNESMPQKFAFFICSLLEHKNLRKVSLLGISFKDGTDDVRCTVTPTIAHILNQAGFKTRAYDPLVSMQVAQSLLPQTEVVGSLEEAVSGSSAIVICSDHQTFRKMNLSSIHELAEPECLLIDGRNIWNPKIVSDAGLSYVALGGIKS